MHSYSYDSLAAESETKVRWIDLSAFIDEEK
jgi:hypothetical protein